MKEKEIITIHKGGRKCKSDPNNYRAITLSSSILKVYEMILLHRCKNKILQSLNRMQGGFQDQLGCIMTSFALRECLNFARECSSSVYMCFLALTLSSFSLKTDVYLKANSNQGVLNFRFRFRTLKV